MSLPSESLPSESGESLSESLSESLLRVSHSSESSQVVQHGPGDYRMYYSSFDPKVL